MARKIASASGRRLCRCNPMAIASAWSIDTAFRGIGVSSMTVAGVESIADLFSLLSRHDQQAQHRLAGFHSQRLAGQRANCESSLGQTVAKVSFVVEISAMRVEPKAQFTGG